MYCVQFPIVAVHQKFLIIRKFDCLLETEMLQNDVKSHTVFLDFWKFLARALDQGGQLRFARKSVAKGRNNAILQAELSYCVEGRRDTRLCEAFRRAPPWAKTKHQEHARDGCVGPRLAEPGTSVLAFCPKQQHPSSKVWRSPKPHEILSGFDAARHL